MVKLSIKIFCFITILFLSIITKSQIVKNDLKVFKEKIIFVDTITIRQPILIKYDFKLSYGGLYFWKKSNQVLFYISSEVYLNRITDRNFSSDSLLFSDICYNYISLVTYIFSNQNIIEKDYYFSHINKMLLNDYTWQKGAINHFNREYIKTNKNGLSYSKLKTNKFAVFLIRDDFFPKKNPKITKYYKVAIPIELKNKEEIIKGSVNPLRD
ncbi:MAG: hypothetical protein LKE30_06520 [Bacteroidales bacterium]|jgi:hypothetical protein|nr:hypothetical protein [Bacteroidales bacterium]